jgi:membrane protease subunit HflK
MSDNFKGQSPWGAPPGGGSGGNGSGRGPTPPNVDELIRDLQNKIKLIDFPPDVFPPGKNLFILS